MTVGTKTPFTVPRLVAVVARYDVVSDGARKPVPAEAKYLIGAIKHLAGEIRNDRAAAGVLLVQSGAAAVVFANRCPSLRAILGTCRESVQQGVDRVDANVLVIEHPYQTLQQVRNMVSLFVRARRELSENVKRQLQELASCG